MRLLARLLERLDDNLTSPDPHLDLAIPQPRSEPAPVRHLTPRGQLRTVATGWPCCKCCTTYTPQPCPVIHPGPCDKPECAEPEDVA